MKSTIAQARGPGVHGATSHRLHHTGKHDNMPHTPTEAHPPHFAFPHVTFRESGLPGSRWRLEFQGPQQLEYVAHTLIHLTI
jgi:hypothetical protein